MIRLVWVAAALAAGAGGCGYHVAGHTNTLPTTVHTIAVPAFRNNTTRYRLSERLPQAVTRELIARTRYNVVSDPEQADAVLKGWVISYAAYPTTFDPATNRASAVQVYVHVGVTRSERATGKVLFQRPDVEARERYEIAADPRAYVDESDAAADRVSRDVAKSVVSAILENF
jgi:hypothetical protein